MGACCTFVIPEDMLTRADVMPEGALDGATSLEAPLEVAKLFQSDSSMKKLIKTLAAKRCRVVEPPTAEQLELGSRAVDPLDSFVNAEMIASSNVGWSVTSGFVLLQASGSGKQRFIALRHSWNAMPSGAWLDLTPLAPTASSSPPRLLIESSLPRQDTSKADDTAALLGRLLGLTAADEEEPQLEVNLEDSVPATQSSPAESRVAAPPSQPKQPPPIKPSTAATPQQAAALSAAAVEDALAGVHAETARGHVRAGPSVAPLKPHGDDGLAIETFKMCATKLTELEKEHAVSAAPPPNRAVSEWLPGCH